MFWKTGSADLSASLQGSPLPHSSPKEAQLWMETIMQKTKLLLKDIKPNLGAELALQNKKLCMVN